jgi:hypothetical protein
MKASGISPGYPGAPGEGIDSEETGLPGFKTWPAVYWFVFVTFVVWVVLLEALSRAFS